METSTPSYAAASSSPTNIHSEIHDNNNNMTVDEEEQMSLWKTAKLARVGSVDQSEQQDKTKASEEEEDYSEHKSEESDEAAAETVQKKFTIKVDLDPGGEEEEDVEMKSLSSNESFDFCGSDSDSDADDKNDGVLIDKSNKRSSISSSFDMRMLRDSIDQGRPILEQVQDKDVILVLGKTGTGKSTLIQGLAGKKFVATMHTTHRSGHTVHKRVFDIDTTISGTTENEPLPGFAIGHVKESKTKHINCHALISYASDNNIKEYFIVDSPGWEDTAGPEVDIATAVMTAAVASRSRSVVFIILINYVSLLEDRGAAIRSVLKLVRTFVPDFLSAKKSFMFLFTHTNEIKSIPEDNLDAARKAVHDEIIRTQDGTTDEDVQQALEFMRKSLKKKFPFCDVFHPLLSDTSKIMSNLGRLKGTPGSHLAKAGGVVSYGGLTSASRFKLQGELHKLAQTLHHALSLLDEQRHQHGEQPTTTNMAQVKEILEIFDTLEGYVDMDQVRNAAAEARQDVCRYIDRLHHCIQEVLQRGTDRNLDFCLANVADLTQSIANLQFLSPIFPAETDYDKVVAHVKKQVERFQNQLLDSPLDGVHHQLQTLRTWAQGIPEFRPLYENSVKCLYKFIESHVSAVLAFHDNVEFASEQKLKEYASRLKVLQTIESNAQHLSSHFDVKRATETLVFVVAGHCTTLDSWAEACVAQLQKAASPPPPQLETVDHATTIEARESAGEYPIPMETSDDAIQMDTADDPLQILIKRARVVEVLNGLLEYDAVCPTLHVKTKSIRDHLADVAPSFFAEACAGLLSTFQTSSPANVEKQLRFISDAQSSYSSVGHPKWADEVRRSGPPVFDSIKSFLKTKSGELDNMTKELSARGVVDGHEAGKALASFAAYKFFDIYVDQRDQFMQCNYIAYARRYKDRAEYVRFSIEQCLGIQDGERGESCSSFLLEDLRSLKPLLSEQREFAHLSETLADESLSVAYGDSQDKVLHCIDQLVTRASKDLAAWKAAVRQTPIGRDIPSLTDRLGTLLLEIALLEELSIGVHKLAMTRSDILREGESFSQEVCTIIDREYRYPSKHACLQALAGIAKATVENHQFIVGVDFQLAKDRVREGIKAHAQQIETMVSETSEWDSIDCLLKKLKRAKILDEFTSGEASSRLVPLRKLRERKEDEVDQLLEKLIADQNYHGLRQFLQPLVQSKDQVKQQKFNHTLSKIASSLSDIFADVRRRLNFVELSEEDLKHVATGIRRIEQANKEVGQYLNSNAHSLQLGDELKNAKIKVNSKFSTYLDKMKAAGAHNFVALETSKIRAMQFQSQMAPFLSDQSKIKNTAAMAHYQKAIQEVSDKMEAFFTSHFDDANILQILVSLKNASLHTSPELPQLTVLYDEKKTQLTDRLVTSLLEMRDAVAKYGCFDDVIGLLNGLDRQLRKGLEDFVASPDLVADIRSQREAWCHEHVQNERGLFGGDMSLDTIKTCKKDLDRCQPGAGIISWILSTFKSYESLRRKIASKAEEKISTGMTAILNRNYSLLQECIKTLDLMNEHLEKHITAAGVGAKKLKSEADRIFNQLCEKTKEILASVDGRRQFQEVFDSYRRFVISVPCVTLAAASKRRYSLTNQLIFDTLSNDVDQLAKWNESFDFESLKKKIDRVRLFGGYVADYVTLFHEEVRCCEHLEEDEWLARIFQLCQEHFGCGRNLNRIQLYALLGVPPSATKKEIKKAYRDQAKKHHPDKQRGMEPGLDEGAMFRKIKEACDELEKGAPSTVSDEKPFDSLLKGIDDSVQKQARAFLSEQRYDEVEKLLSRLDELHLLDTLVTPPLQSQKAKDGIADLVKNHVEAIRVKVNTNWSERNYKALNDNIADLKQMEERFKNHPNIISASWNDGIVASVEDEINELGRHARRYLVDQATAKNDMQDFRRILIKMGSVLVELPIFFHHTKTIMSDVLETCLASDWGYSYLFDLGLSLQRSDENSTDEENLVAQEILGQFSHFKEVLTMVWNEETSQKPVEDTVRDIKGHVRKGAINETLSIDTAFLLENFREFFGEYKSLIGEYLSPEAELNVLVQRVIEAANSLKPITCDSSWGLQTKQQVPHILAGVFAVFTILKSGASYNRIGGNASLGDKLLVKPHNIQVLTLLCMFGCSSPSSDSLDSQLMQIRTGEGKSMILGAAAVVLGLLGFSTRCVCYSDFLSTRDYNLLKDVFQAFGLTGLIKYSKITTLSEDTTAAKGDIRFLTEKLLRGHPMARNNLSHRDTDVTMTEASSPSAQNSTNAHKKNRSQKQGIGSDLISAVPPRHMQTDGREEILLVDEVDVFFGSEFYGQTYNQVALVREPEVKDILRQIWDANKRGGRRLRLSDIQATQAYNKLIQKISDFKSLVDSEISSMLSQVRLVDEEPYYLDPESGRIGYKVMDSISFEVTYGYRTVFAYLKEAEKGTLRSMDSVLSNVMAMQVSCGQFSYANISPARILGVSGTLDAMGDYENSVLAKYGISRFLFVPSVYGQSNFSFDKAGDGIVVDANKSDYFQSITDKIIQDTREKRAVIVFFRDKKRMDEFTSSPFYHKLGRQNKVLSEEMAASEKEFVISKAATCGQITISSAVFGRGTDFFCKDDRVQKNGGVHVIQAFLSEERSEEIQIQGRTARQGKKGSYQMVILEADLRDGFGIPVGTVGSISKSDMYPFLCQARQKQREKHCQAVEQNLSEATASDRRTHRYFDALLAGESRESSRLLVDLYTSYKKKQRPQSIDVDLAFVVDVTGSMGPYAAATTATLKCIVDGSTSVASKLRAKFPEIQFKVRISCMGYRDVDDKPMQFHESTWRSGGHFTENIGEVVQFITKTLASPSGGGDIAEDHLGAINRCSTWQSPGDWESQIKFIMLITDAPAHGMVPPSCEAVPNADNYATLHPAGLTPSTVVGNLIKRGIDLFLCSYNPAATWRTEEELAQQFLDHPENKEKREVTVIPMVPKVNEMSVALGRPGSALIGDFGKHIIFALDESGSMSNDWSGVIAAYTQYLHRRKQNQKDSDLVSVVQFDDYARATVSLQPLGLAPADLSYRGGGTCFYPAAVMASQLAAQTPASHSPVVVFMSDGGTYDAAAAANVFAMLNHGVRQRCNNDLELHVIGFGGGADTQQLQQIASASPNGKLYTSADTAELSSIFVNIAGGQDVGIILTAEVGKRISEAVADRLAVEYLC